MRIRPRKINEAQVVVLIANVFIVVVTVITILTL